eukprot:TRINITY_DN1425_c5_g1_i1.p1 TRINITY_DN1425_c5_g1~~TRINITY_DN1425_c5_g1_i1.p1  ORF type:complete len:236 (+),score=62.45 TRINITY_DN1425_c5_g1_i1:64-708(+)
MHQTLGETLAGLKAKLNGVQDHATGYRSREADIRLVKGEEYTLMAEVAKAEGMEKTAALMHKGHHEEVRAQREIENKVEEDRRNILSALRESEARLTEADNEADRHHTLSIHNKVRWEATRETLGEAKAILADRHASTQEAFSSYDTALYTHRTATMQAAMAKSLLRADNEAVQQNTRDRWNAYQTNDKPAMLRAMERAQGTAAHSKRIPISLS